MKTLLTAAATAAALSAGAASAATITFDTLDTTSLLTSFTEGGFSFDVSFTTLGGSPGAAVFDTTCMGGACNGDDDLIPGMQGENGIEGNVLILQEDGSPIPDDDVQGGSITLTLTAGNAFQFLGASTIDDTTFTFSSSVDGLLGSTTNTADNETSMASFTSSFLGLGDSITIGYGGSGGVDSLILAPVPVPAALPLLLAGLGGLAWVGRRKRA